ncbi:hypothetical protein Tco_1429552, partial [Tanacetum coccineum]
ESDLLVTTKVITDVNVNKLHQPWRSFAAVINKCLSGKSIGYDSLRLSQAQILWGMYHKKNVDYVYLLWEDFVYQVETKNVKRGNDDDDDDADNQDDDDNDDDDDQIDDNTDNENDDNDDDGQDHEEDNEEEGSDLRVQTPSLYESTDDEESDEVTHGANFEGEKLDEEETNEEDEANELYRHVNVNLEGDTEMTDAIIQTTQVIEDTHVIITPVNPEGIDSIFNLKTESTSMVDVSVTTIAEPPLLSATILPPPPTYLITHLQQTLVPTPATIPSSSLQDLPNFGSLFGFDHRLKTLETDFSKFKQMNQFAAAVSSIPSIVDAYLANKMHEDVKTAIQLQSDILRDEAQAENETSYAVAANLSELELKKILIDKMESNKSIHISDEQKNLYKALVDAYESEKLILDTYGDTVSFKRRRDNEDKDEEPSAGSNRGSKRRRAGKEPESTSLQKEKTSKKIGKSTEGSKSHHKSAQAEEPMHTAEDLEEPPHHEFFQKPAKPPTPDRDWNKTLPAAHGPVQLWLSTLAQKEDTQLEYFFEEVYKVTTDQLDWNNPEGQQYPHDLRKPLPLIPNSRGKLTNLTVEERLAFNVSLRIFTRSIVIQRRVEDLQLGVESYQKKLNLIKPDMYSDSTLNDVRTALNDRLKGIRMKHLPQNIWRQSDRDKARAMIQAIDKQLKTRRIMRSLEKFVGGKLYEGDFWLLERTI